MAFSCYFSNRKWGRDQLTSSDIREPETCKMARKSVGHRGAKGVAWSCSTGGGRRKKKDGPGKQDQQMAALNTWDDSITDKSQEEVAAGCRSTKRPDRAALDDLRGPSLPRSLCGPTGPWTSMQTSVEKRKERKIPSTGSAINLNCVIPSTYCRPRWNPNEKSTIKTRQKRKKVKEEDDQVILFLGLRKDVKS